MARIAESIAAHARNTRLTWESNSAHLLIGVGIQYRVAAHLNITYVGGPTLLLEFGEFRLLTDPTFDPPGGEYTTVQ